MLIAERERWVLWIPVGYALGVGLYFNLGDEPLWWLGSLVAALASIGCILARPASAARMAMIAALIVAAGFAGAQLRALAVAAPIVEARSPPLEIEGRLIEVEAKGGRTRLLLDRLQIADWETARTPRRIRVTTAALGERFAAGERVAMRAILLPPPEPAAPGAFDFARRAYFEGLGAVGFTLGAPTSLPPRPGVQSGGVWQDWLIAWARLRQVIASRVSHALDGQVGALAVALTTGERGFLDDRTLQAMRDSGLAHLLAISGLHLGLVAGLVFAGCRALLALIPGLALRFPIKKWAALAGLGAAFCYLFLVGATVPTQRAFIMVALALTAVLLDRTAISLRTVAFAAFVVLVLRPESLLTASFQLSFAAVVALVAAYEHLGRRARALGLASDGQRWRPSERLLLYLAGVALTSVIAIAATAPFALYHFHRITPYGLLSNLAAVPVTAFWIMPWALISYATVPLGLEAGPLWMMGLGIKAVLSVAHWVSALPGAVRPVPAIPDWAPVLLALGGLWLCLWRGRWRFWGLFPIAFALASVLVTRPPDILMNEDGGLIGLRGPKGALYVNDDRREAFTREIWAERQGLARASHWESVAADRARSWLNCDPAGCIYRREGAKIAIAFDGRALAEDCHAVDVMISLEPLRGRRCPRASAVIDRFDLWRAGGHAIRIDGIGAIEIESVRGRRGRRPWVRWPRR